MAKPLYGLAGNSGHIHISLVDNNGKNLFARDTMDRDAKWKDIQHLSDASRHFLAGVLEALPDIMPLFAPTINSYKGLVENHWTPVYLSWGLGDRMASVRLIAPPVCKPSATRLEVRIPLEQAVARFQRKESIARERSSMMFSWIIMLQPGSMN